MNATQEDRTDRGLSILPSIKAPKYPSGARGRAAHERGECVDGWLGSMAAPTPCPVCRPHLVLRTDGWRVTTAKEWKSVS